MIYYPPTMTLIFFFLVLLWITILQYFQVITSQVLSVLKIQTSSTDLHWVIKRDPNIAWERPQLWMDSPVKIQRPVTVAGNKCKLLPFTSQFLKTTLGSKRGRQKVNKGVNYFLLLILSSFTPAIWKWMKGCGSINPRSPRAGLRSGIQRGKQ